MVVRRQAAWNELQNYNDMNCGNTCLRLLGRGGWVYKGEGWVMGTETNDEHYFDEWSEYYF